MPIKTIQRPDGGVDEIEYPENTPDEVVNAAVKVHLQSLRTAETERGVAESAARLRDVPPEFRGMSRAYEGMGAPTEQLTSPYATTATGTVLSRVGVPLAAGIVSGGFGLLPAMATGMAASGAGEFGAQAIEKAAGEREKFSPGQIAGSAISGSAPVFKGAGTLGSGLLATAKTAGSQAAGGMLGRAAEDVVEGRPVDALETAQAGAIPLAVSGALGLLGNAAGAASRGAGKAIQRGQTLENIGVVPTAEQMLPSGAAFARRMVESSGSAATTLRGKLYQQADDLQKAVMNIAGGADQKSIAEIGGNIIEGLGEEGKKQFIADSQRISNLQQTIDNARDSALKARLEITRNELSDQLKYKMAASLGLDNVEAFEKVAQGQAIAKNVKDALGAFQDKASELYSDVNKVADAPAFSIQTPVGGKPSLADQAIDLQARVPSIAKLGDFNKLTEKLAGQPSGLASLNEMRGIARDLEEFAANTQEAIGSNQKRLLREFASSIRSAIDEQAPMALGPDIARSLKDANNFYKQFAPDFERLGIKDIFRGGGEPADQIAQRLASDVFREGVDTKRYQNIQSLFEKMRNAGVEGVPTDAAMKSAVRSGIVSSAITDHVNGVIDYNKLYQTLAKMEASAPGTMKELGFGSAKEMKELASAMQSLPATVSTADAAKFQKLIDEGNHAGIWFSADAVRRIEDTLTRENLMEALRAKAISGSKEAADAIRQIKTKYLTDMFDFASTGKANQQGIDAVQALQRMNEALASGEAETLLGKNTVDLMKQDILPALKVMAESYVETKNVGAIARSNQPARLAATAGRASEQLASGRIDKALASLFGRAVSEGYYGLLAGAIANGTGVSGLVNKQRFLQNMERIASLPTKTAQMQALYRYAAGEPEKK